jgi:hypothetical protein
MLHSNNGHGILYPSVCNYITNPLLSVSLNVLCIIGIGLLLLVLNKLFSFIKTVTWVFVSMFYLITLSSPLICTNFFTGTLLSLTVVIITFALFASFQARRSQRSIYSAFAVVTAFSLFHVAFIYLIPVLMLGFMLMQSMNMRSLLAMGMGIVTPFWIVLGLDLASFSDFIIHPYGNLWAELDISQLRVNIICIVFIATATIVLTCVNLIQIINYKQQARAYNGFFVYLAAASILMLAIDYRNAMVYLPVINLCFAVQFGHFFAFNNRLRRYLIVVFLILAVIATHILHIAL